jgi:hypothetical protein
MTERTVRYLVVDDVLADVPDAAPEVDGPVASANDILALLSRVGVGAAPQAIYLHTLRPGTKNDWRWQPLAAVSQLPPPPAPLVVKILRSALNSGPNPAALAAAAAGGAAAGGAAAVAATSQQQPRRPPGGGGPFGIGRLLRGVARIVTGGGGGGGGPRPRPSGGGGAASSAAAMHAANTRFMDDRWREDEMMRQRLEDHDRQDAEERAQIDNMLAGPDRDGDGVPDALEEQQQQEENYGAFEDNGIVENDGNDNYGSFENDDNGGGDDDNGGGDDDGGGFGDDD